MKTRVLLGAGLLLICVIGDSGAVELEPDCARNAACLVLSDQANEQSSAGKLEEALRLYKLAYEVQADPRLLYNIARVLHKQRNTVDAVPFYQKFLESRLSDDEQKRKARDYLNEILAPPLVTSAAAQNPSGANLSNETTKTTSTTRAHRYYKGGWIASISVASTLVATSIPFWYFATLDGQTSCGVNVPRNQCPLLYQGNIEIAVPLLTVGLAHVIPFGILLYFDRKEQRKAGPPSR